MVLILCVALTLRELKLRAPLEGALFEFRKDYHMLEYWTKACYAIIAWTNLELLAAFAGFDLHLYLANLFLEGVPIWWGLPLLGVRMIGFLMVFAIMVWIVFATFGDNDEDWTEVPSLGVSVLGVLGGLFFLYAYARDEAVVLSGLEAWFISIIFLGLANMFVYLGIDQARRFT